MKLLKQIIVAIVFFCTAAVASAANQLPQENVNNTSSSVNTLRNQVLSEFVELDKTNTFITIEMTHSGGCKTRHLIQEGAMAYISIENETPARFIVSKNKDTQQFELLPVVQSKFVAHGKLVSGLKILGALPWGKVSDDLSQLGIVGVNLTAVNDKAELDAAINRAFPGAEKRLPTKAKCVCPEQPCDCLNCCEFSACGGKAGRFCTTGSAGCGGDGCGECCI